MLFHILESEILEAQAQYDFTARSSREVSFRTGDSITLFSQVWSCYARPLYWWLFCSGRLAVTGGGGAWQGGRGLFRISTFSLKLGNKYKQIPNSSILSLISGEMRISRIPTNPFLQTDTEVPVTQTPWDPPGVSMFLIPPLKVLIHPHPIPWPLLYYAPHHTDTPSATPHPSQLIIPHPLANRWRK